MAPKPNELVYKLADLLQGSLTSMEILPGGLKEWDSIELPPEALKPSADFPFVFMEGNLGIPKKVLCALYLTAISMPWRASAVKETDAASSIIILLNPAHQTAMNARKRLMEEGHLDPRKELIFTELISRGSTECAKQSILWEHRRWCFRKIYGVMGPDISGPPQQSWASSEEIQQFPKLSPSMIQCELDLIHHTCETYPRNYHSWAHWHYVMDVCHASIYLFDDGDNRREFLGIITTECTRLRRWVENHVADYSAIHQLCQIQKLIDTLEANGMLASNIAGDLISSGLADHASSLVFAFPSHEALWMYLKVALENLRTDDREKILEKVQSENSLSPRFKRRLVDWFSR
ncbi:hypothetical protein GALMADRAFT_140324 [Galerina marginata CBS 339.88]|uniref:Protein prenyltransferase alpha subunit repeat-containing protein 1 n=1 Tax=Galerina marginata (strain CBS 339.88) TaxID=685588 RepID=A0A067T055_GALM3|nr:hypothetical protein GALMADRAFT_140324 [Galerina marginata CBS 339.88]